MRSFEQDFRHQKSAKTPVNKGQNDFSTQKSPTSLGEEPPLNCLERPVQKLRTAEDRGGTRLRDDSARFLSEQQAEGAN